LVSEVDSLLPLREVEGRLRVLGQSYAGMQTIPIERIVGSVDRSVDFDRFFRPRKRSDLRQRINSLRAAFADSPIPPISVYEASGLYFVSDGHHRVALTRADGGEFIDAEVTALRLSNQLHPGVDVLELVHTQQHDQFMTRTQLNESHPEMTIEFSRPIGYWELTDLIQAHGYTLSAGRGEFVPLPKAAMDWYDQCWLPAQAAISATSLRSKYDFKTPSDLYLWVHYKLRELRTIDAAAGWQAAADARAAEPVQKSHIEAARRERRTLLPRAGQEATH
jgi:hypothetical protein